MGFTTFVLAVFFLVYFGNTSVIHAEQNVDFYSVESDSRFNGLSATSGYTKKVTGNDWLQCAAKCVLTADCDSFFFDSSTSICQFHGTILLDTAGLTSSTTSQYYKMNKGCPTGWYTFRSSCYFVDTHTNRTYLHAKAYCGAIGANVLRIEDAEESTFFKQLLPTVGALDIENRYWIGLTDLITANHWIWEDTGETPTYTDWSSGEPNLAVEHCAMIFRDYSWYDVICERLIYTICEI